MGESKVNLGAGSPRFKIDNDSYGTVFFDPDNPQYGPAFGPTASEVKDPGDALEAVPYEYPVFPSFRREGSPKISFGIGGYQVYPQVFVEGSQTSRTPTVSLPEGDVRYDQKNFNLSGKLGADVKTPGGDAFGASAAGYAYRGGIEFPDAMKAYGAEDFTYNSRGVEPSEYRGYYQMKGGPRAEGFYRPSADPTREDEYGGRVSYTTSFEEGGGVPAGLGSLPEAANILTSGSISMSPSKSPNVEPRTAALGAQILNRAKIPGNFPEMLKNADPQVISQINRIMARPEGKRLQSPSQGISLLMPLGVETS